MPKPAKSRTVWRQDVRCDHAAHKRCPLLYCVHKTPHDCDEDHATAPCWDPKIQDSFKVECVAHNAALRGGVLAVPSNGVVGGKDGGQ